MAKVIDLTLALSKIDELKAALTGMARDEAVVNPPPVTPPPITPPPVTTPPTTGGVDMSKEVASAVAVNGPIDPNIGRHRTNVSLGVGQSIYVLIDMKNTPGYQFTPSVTKPQIQIFETQLNMYITKGLIISTMELDANNKLVHTYGQPYATGGVSRVTVVYDQARYDAGHKFLIKITEPGQAVAPRIEVAW